MRFILIRKKIFYEVSFDPHRSSMIVLNSLVITHLTSIAMIVSCVSLIADANECSAEKNPCDTKTSQCFDLKGGFKCLCKHGYKQVPNTNLCERK